MKRACLQRSTTSVFVFERVTAEAEGLEEAMFCEMQAGRPSSSCSIGAGRQPIRWMLRTGERMSTRSCMRSPCSNSTGLCRLSVMGMSGIATNGSMS